MTQGLVIVTGAAFGMGRSTAIELARAAGRKVAFSLSAAAASAPPSAGGWRGTAMPSR